MILMRSSKPSSRKPNAFAQQAVLPVSVRAEPSGKAFSEYRERRQFPRPLPAPEVHEGDGGSNDWELWVSVAGARNTP